MNILAHLKNNITAITADSFTACFETILKQLKAIERNPEVLSAIGQYFKSIPALLSSKNANTTFFGKEPS